jgi:hypothetical protein
MVRGNYAKMIAENKLGRPGLSSSVNVFNNYLRKQKGCKYKRQGTELSAIQQSLEGEGRLSS